MRTYIYFTYRLDTELTLLSIEQLRLVEPTAAIVVVDDHCNPWPHQQRIKLCDFGVNYRLSTHKRNGSLHGYDHLKYATELYAQLAKAGRGTIIKVDPDTLILSTKWLDDFEANGKDMLAGGCLSQHNYITGAAYALATEATELLKDDVAQFVPWHNCLEDFEIGSRIERIYPDQLDLRQVNRSDWVLSYTHPKIDIPWLRSQQVINLGRWEEAAQIPPADHRIALAALYRHIIDLNKETQK